MRFTEPVGPAGAPLLVLGPSLGTSAILWEDVVPLLADRYRVTAWELPGHGAAPATTDSFTIGELADAVAAAIAEFGGQAFYAGISIGGATGLELLLRHPDLVDAAAVLASGASLATPESWRERAAQVRAQSTSSLISGSAQRWFGPTSVADRPELTGRLLHVLQDADDESYALACEALAAYDVREQLGGIEAPLLVVWGEHDQVAPVEKAGEIASGVANAELVEIEDAAHLPAAERPAATAAVLGAFFDAHSRREGASR
nr:alpha/beta fold hydrolase [Agromyces seonyuensis]